MTFQAPTQLLTKLDNFKSFHFLTLITTSKANPWNKTGTPAKLQYLTKNADSFSMRKEEFLKWDFGSKMRVGVTYGVRATNKYNGQFVGIIFFATKQTDGSIKLNWREKTLNKTINRLPSTPKGTKYKQGRKKSNYIGFSIMREREFV